MKKGIARIVFGVILIIVQSLSYIGNAKAGVTIQFFHGAVSAGQLLYDIVTFASYNLIGIIGLILLISGIVAYNRKENNNER